MSTTSLHAKPTNPGRGDEEYVATGRRARKERDRRCLAFAQRSLRQTASGRRRWCSSALLAWFFGLVVSSTSGFASPENFPDGAPASDDEVHRDPTDVAVREEPPSTRSQRAPFEPLVDPLWNPNYRKFQPWQYATLSAAVVGLAVRTFIEEPPSEPRWIHAGPIDRFFRDRIDADNPRRQSRFRLASDILYGVVTPLPIALDGALMLPIVRKSPEVAAQVLLIDLQSFAFTGVAYFGIRAIAHRTRPEITECIEEFGRENCAHVRSPNYSFFSGHSAFAFTGAGLMCTHQRFLNVYKNETVGRALCGTTMAAAATAAAFRIVANRHWLSDVLTGAGIGLFSGLALPRLLNFSPPRLRRSRTQPAFVFATPMFVGDGGGVTVFGFF